MSGLAVATYAAVYVWTSDGVRVLDSEFEDCGRAITVDQPDGPARISGNRIYSLDSSRMATGIWIRRSSGTSEGEVVVADNRVTGARLDPGGVGAEGHGIAVFRCQDARITNNHCEGNGRGILVSNQSFGAVLQGNTCIDNNDVGIRCEPEISSRDVTAGIGARRGITVVGNVCRNNAAIGTPGGANSGAGISMSYAAGSTVSGNIVHSNTADGIFNDSDRVTIVGNIVYNNWLGYTADPSIGRRGGIRIYAGNGCTVVGNQCFDSQATEDPAVRPVAVQHGHHARRALQQLRRQRGRGVLGHGPGGHRVLRRTARHQATQPGDCHRPQRAAGGQQPGAVAA